MRIKPIDENEVVIETEKGERYIITEFSGDLGLDVRAFGLEALEVDVRHFENNRPYKTYIGKEVFFKYSRR